eukprot:102601-Prymnesium_polylepis.1
MARLRSPAARLHHHPGTRVAVNVPSKRDQATPQLAGPHDQQRVSVSQIRKLSTLAQPVDSPDRGQRRRRRRAAQDRVKVASPAVTQLPQLSFPDGGL